MAETAPTSDPRLDLATPEFVSRELRNGRRPGWRRFVALLVVVLGLQLLVVQWDRLAELNWSRPWLERVCAVFGCELAPWYAPHTFTVVSRDVRPYPDTGNVLQASLSFRNDAPFAQAWPVLEVRFLDINGKVTGVRRFSAADYLGEAPPRTRIASGQTVNAELVLFDPGQSSLSYEFQFF